MRCVGIIMGERRLALCICTVSVSESVSKMRRSATHPSTFPTKQICGPAPAMFELARSGGGVALGANAELPLFMRAPGVRNINVQASHT